MIAFSQNIRKMALVFANKYVSVVDPVKLFKEV